MYVDADDDRREFGTSGLLPKKKDWPIVIANVPGIFLAATAFITALIA